MSHFSKVSSYFLNEIIIANQDLGAMGVIIDTGVPFLLSNLS
jgi:hypothetical protein